MKLIVKKNEPISLLSKAGTSTTQTTAEGEYTEDQTKSKSLRTNDCYNNRAFPNLTSEEQARVTKDTNMLGWSLGLWGFQKCVFFFIDLVSFRTCSLDFKHALSYSNMLLAFKTCCWYSKHAVFTL